MVERSGCSLLAVHGRTRDQKDNSGIRADWDSIKAVKQVREGAGEKGVCVQAECTGIRAGDKWRRQPPLAAAVLPAVATGYGSESEGRSEVPPCAIPPLLTRTQALSIPVLANGNIRNLQDALDCMQYTGCDGVLSAESLLVDPALFSPSRVMTGVSGVVYLGACLALCASLPDYGDTGVLEVLHRALDAEPYKRAPLVPSSQQEHNFVAGISLLRDYLRLAMAHPVPMRMVKGHVHKLITPWLSEHHDLRDKVNCGGLSLQVQIGTGVGAWVI